MDDDAVLVARCVWYHYGHEEVRRRRIGSNRRTRNRRRSGRWRYSSAVRRPKAWVCNYDACKNAHCVFPIHGQLTLIFWNRERKKRERGQRERQEVVRGQECQTQSMHADVSNWRPSKDEGDREKKRVKGVCVTMRRMRNVMWNSGAVKRKIKGTSNTESTHNPWGKTTTEKPSEVNNITDRICI